MSIIHSLYSFLSQLHHGSHVSLQDATKEYVALTGNLTAMKLWDTKMMADHSIAYGLLECYFLTFVII